MINIKTVVKDVTPNIQLYGNRWEAGERRAKTSMASRIEKLPLDIIRLILESFLFKSAHTFKDVVSFACSSKSNYLLLKEGWLKRLYDHEFYLYVRQTSINQGVFHGQIPGIVKTLKIQRGVLKRKRENDGGRAVKDGDRAVPGGDPNRMLIKKLARGKSWIQTVQ